MVRQRAGRDHGLPHPPRHARLDQRSPHLRRPDHRPLKPRNTTMTVYETSGYCEMNIVVRYHSPYETYVIAIDDDGTFTNEGCFISLDAAIRRAEKLAKLYGCEWDIDTP